MDKLRHWHLALLVIGLFVVLFFPLRIQAEDTTVQIQYGDTVNGVCPPGGTVSLVVPPPGSQFTASCIPPDTTTTPVSTASVVPTATNTPAATSTPLPPTVSPTPSVDTIDWSTGYYVGWWQDQYPPNTIPWQSITHLVHFGLLSNTDGTTDSGAGHSLTPQKMTDAVAAAHANGKKILIAVGGAEDENFDEACNAQNRFTFVTNVLSFIQVHDYDGVDLDMERDYNIADFKACVELFRSQLNQIKPGSLLTMPSDDWQQHLMREVHPVLDQINLMTYWTPVVGVDRNGKTLVQILTAFTDAGIPRSKLGIGMGLGDDGGIDTTAAACDQKARYALENNYGGVMQWIVTDDQRLHVGQTPCLNEVVKYLEGIPVPTPTPIPSPTASPVATQTVPATPTNTSVSTSTVTATATPPVSSAPAAMTVASRGVPAFASSNNYPASNGNDNDYSSNWRSGQVPTVSNPAWLLYDISGKGVGQAVVWWSNNYTGDYLNLPTDSFYAVPRDYIIEVNAAPGGTPPQNGWVTLASVTENAFPVRSHLVNLTGYNWISMTVTRSRGGAGNNDVAFQLDVFNAPNGFTDSWLMLGDSITLEGILPQNITGEPWDGGSLAQLVSIAEPDRFPLLIHGGNGGMNMAWANQNKAALIAPFPGRYVSLAYGSNDANTSTLSQTSLANYYNNLLAVVDYVIAQGKIPVVPKIPWGCKASMANNTKALNDYVEARLFTARPQVIRGPDLWTYYKNNPSLLRDCLHPTFTASGTNLNGYEQMQRQWRDAMRANVYGN